MEEDDMFIDYTPAFPSNISSPEYEGLPSAISIDEIVAEQRVDSFCQTALANAGKFTSFFEDEDGILRRRLPFGRKLTPVVLPSTLRPRALR